MSGIGIVLNLLRDAPAVTAITTDDSRIHPFKLPQMGEVPAVVVNLVGMADRGTLSGAGRYYQERIRTESLGKTPSECVDLGAAVLRALEDIVKQTVGPWRDVDVRFANMAESAYSVVWEKDVLIQDFYVDWRD